MGDTYGQGTALPGKSLSTRIFWFPRLFCLVSTCPRVLPPSPPGGGIYLSNTQGRRTEQNHARCVILAPNGGRKRYSPLAHSPGRWLTTRTHHFLSFRRRKREVEQQVEGDQGVNTGGSHSTWKETPGLEKKHSPLRALPLCRELGSINNWNFLRGRRTSGECGT